MADLGTMRTRLASELDRNDLSSQISLAIQDAIEFHERERFWFNESRDLTFSTVDEQRIYTSADASWIPNVIQVDAMFVSVGGSNRELVRDDAIIHEIWADNSAAQGAPTSWTTYNSSIYLYPIPDQVYTVRALAHYRLTTISLDADSNAWTTEAEQLIRRTARIFIGIDVTDARDDAMAFDVAVGRQLENLRAETSRRRSTGIIHPTSF